MSDVIVKPIRYEGKRYIMATEVADILRGVANSIEGAAVLSGPEFAEALREVARNLEQAT